MKNVSIMTFIILVVGIAVSAPTKSMIGAKATVTTSNAEMKYTARDYVQEGLVAIWDGIENIGYGLHDSNATVWIDLSGNDNHAIVSNGTFDNNSFGISGITATGIYGAKATLSGKYAFEIAIKDTRGSLFAWHEGLYYCVNNSFGIGKIITTSNTYWARLDGNGCNNGLNLKGILMPLSNVGISSTKNRYDNLMIGESEIVSVSGFTSRVFTLPDDSLYLLYNYKAKITSGRVYCIRLYSTYNKERSLYNYNIDKERFNLQ